MSKIILTSCGICATTYTAWIAYKDKNRQVDRYSFRTGTADDLIMDNLRTGDIVLFNRRWYNYHIPTAAMIKLYQALFGCEFDHCGVISLDKLGIPHILEYSPFGGAILYRFDDRVIKSKSHQIVTVPLLPRADFTKTELEKLNKRIENLKGKSTSEFISQTKNFGAYFSGISYWNRNSPPPILCCNTQLVLDCLTDLGLTFDLANSGQRFITSQIFIDGSISCFKNIESGKSKVNFGNQVLIRTN